MNQLKKGQEWKGAFSWHTFSIRLNVFSSKTYYLCSNYGLPSAMPLKQCLCHKGKRIRCLFIKSVPSTPLQLEGQSDSLHYIFAYKFKLFTRSPIWRNTKIGLLSQRNSEKLYIFWRTSENRNIVGHGNFAFWMNEYGKAPILRTLILLKQWCKSVPRSQWYFEYLNLTSNRITNYTNPICFKHFGELHWKFQHFYDKRLGPTWKPKSMMTIGRNRKFWKNWNGNRKSYPFATPPFILSFSNSSRFYRF